MREGANYRTSLSFYISEKLEPSSEGRGAELRCAGGREDEKSLRGARSLFIDGRSEEGQIKYILSLSHPRLHIFDFEDFNRERAREKGNELPILSYFQLSLSQSLRTCK